MESPNCVNVIWRYSKLEVTDAENGFQRFPIYGVKFNVPKFELYKLVRKILLIFVKSKSCYEINFNLLLPYPSNNLIIN